MHIKIVNNTVMHKYFENGKILLFAIIRYDNNLP